VSHRTPGSTSLTIVVLLSTLAACDHELPPPIVLPAPEQTQPDALRWSIEAALAERRWSVTTRAPGRIRAGVYSDGSGDRAVVDVFYYRGAIEIRAVDRDVSTQRYDRWIQLLSAEIQKNVALLGMGRGPTMVVPAPIPMFPPPQLPANPPPEQAAP
jgi:hypothetical protein